MGVNRLTIQLNYSSEVNQYLPNLRCSDEQSSTTVAQRYELLHEPGNYP